MQLAVVLGRDGDAAFFVEGDGFGIGIEAFLAVGDYFGVVLGFLLGCGHGDAAAGGGVTIGHELAGVDVGFL